jgi:hypothetical protein
MIEEAIKSSPYDKDLAKWYIKWLRNVFSEDWFDSRKSIDHPARHHLKICTEILRNDGYIMYPTQTDYLEELCSITYLAEVYQAVSNQDSHASELIEFYGSSAVQKKIDSRLRDKKQYSEVLFELRIGAWHIKKGYEVIPFEKRGWPDFLINIADPHLSFLVECKVLSTSSKKRLIKIIDKANAQIKAATCEIGELPGVLIIDLSNLLRGMSYNTAIGKINKIESEVRKILARPFFKSVSTVILAWDDLVVSGQPPRDTLAVFNAKALMLNHSFFRIPPIEHRYLYVGGRLEVSYCWLEERKPIDDYIFQGNSEDYPACGINRSNILKAIREADREFFSADGGREYRYYMKRVDTPKGGFYALVTADRRADSVYIGSAFKVPFSLLERIHELNPIEMLELMACRFGLKMIVNGESFKV